MEMRVRNSYVPEDVSTCVCKCMNFFFLFKTFHPNFLAPQTMAFVDFCTWLACWWVPGCFCFCLSPPLPLTLWLGLCPLNFYMRARESGVHICAAGFFLTESSSQVLKILLLWGNFDIRGSDKHCSIWQVQRIIHIKPVLFLSSLIHFYPLIFLENWKKIAGLWLFI